MVATFVTYDGDGLTDSFAIPFDYDTPSEVVVTWSGGDAVYTYISDYLIQLTTPAVLGVGESLSIQRVTDIEAPVVSFRNGSGTTGNQLNSMVNQLLRGLQEVANTTLRAIYVNALGVYDFGGKRLTNIGAPVDPGDVARKADVDAVTGAAAASAVLAQNAADTAEDAKAIANSASLTALQASSDAEMFRDQAQAYANSMALPTIDAADDGKVLSVNPLGEWSLMGLNALAFRDTIDDAALIDNGVISYAKLANITYAADYRALTDNRVISTNGLKSALALVNLPSTSGSIAWDMATAVNLTVTLSGNGTLSNATNTVVGKSGFIRVIQGGTGSNTLALSSSYKTMSGLGINLSTAVGAVDVLFYIVISSTFILIMNTKDWK
jgi:hypothetical protein